MGFFCRKQENSGPEEIPNTRQKRCMKIRIAPLTENPLSLLRRLGYAFQRQEGDEMSFVRVLAQSGYPRFHCYTRVNKMELTLSLHLDQKKHTYGEDTRHHGEYEDEGPLGEEGRRILASLGDSASIL
jgi:hypothetical protein